MKIQTVLLLVLFYVGALPVVEAQQKKDAFISLFDGKTLKGWAGDTSVWRAEQGTLVGEVKPGVTLRNNTFLIWQGDQPGDFELVAEFKITETGNSGINYRSEPVSGVPYGLKGYQADIDGKHTYTGQNYEERGRGFLAKRGEQSRLEAGQEPAITGSLGDGDELRQKIKSGDWNECRLVIKGNRMQHYINGVLMSDVTDGDAGAQKISGLLGLQVHVGPPMKVAYRNIRIRAIR
ncbi:3-keto-disaccharide hydrolase [Parachryseolinea silvisoli]|jgi:hypothetical protein|uniref:3-keto-disaccharide hydrolase n=1 Tax=Parachryseolinea silvisoli TaxID=2873601 RepID=UPI0022657EAF|nr:DUF1080 domain-containing protein [Parachryseolinea silvisoli]MCD9018424.1 DUF1080 domain-containing protein [Parachryseolinea silvisoli]